MHRSLQRREGLQVETGQAWRDCSLSHKRTLSFSLSSFESSLLGLVNLRDTILHRAKLQRRTKYAPCGFARLALNSRDGRGRSAEELSVSRLVYWIFYGILVVSMKDSKCNHNRQCPKSLNPTWKLKMYLWVVCGSNFAVIPLPGERV